jgi:excisionase family DNA binding protein
MARNEIATFSPLLDAEKDENVSVSRDLLTRNIMKGNCPTILGTLATYEKNAIENAIGERKQRKKVVGAAHGSIASAPLCADGLVKPYPDAAAFLSISKTSIYKLMQSGKIPYVRVTDGGDVRIPRTALIEFAEARLIKRVV